MLIFPFEVLFYSHTTVVGSGLPCPQKLVNWLIPSKLNHSYCNPRSFQAARPSSCPGQDLHVGTLSMCPLFLALTSEVIQLICSNLTSERLGKLNEGTCRTSY